MSVIENMPFVRRIINTPAYFFEQYQIIDMLDESGRKHHSDDEIEDFIEPVKKSLSIRTNHLCPGQEERDYLFEFTGEGPGRKNRRL
jgi:hypothetical protein